MSNEETNSWIRYLARKTVSMQRFLTHTHTFIYRLTGGRIGGQLGFHRAQVLLLTTIGRKSGKQRTIPLLYIFDNDCLIIVASNGGSAKNPCWCLNLQTTPNAVVQLERQKLKIIAEQAVQKERKHLWSLITALYPGYTDYQKRTDREIPVFILHPIGFK